MDVQVITITVADLEKSRQFYEDVLNFEVKAFFEPTRWISYHCHGGAFFGILEASQPSGQPPEDEIFFFTEDIETLWLRVKDCVKVVEPLHETLWGGNQFVITDPDGYKLGFVKNSEKA
jgi:predicted enzyme related to lactoylglutathione lyase